jgi:hypothetical protein
MVNSNIILNNSYSLTTSNYLTGSGTYYINSVTVSFDHSKYDKTNHIVKHRGLNLPVYISKNGRPFIFAINKRGCEYKKYLK